MILKKIIITLFFLLSIPVLIFFRKKTSQNMRKSISIKNEKVLHFYDNFNKISHFIVNKIFPIMILIFLILFWFDIIKIPIKK